MQKLKSEEQVLAEGFEKKSTRVYEKKGSRERYIICPSCERLNLVGQQGRTTGKSKTISWNCSYCPGENKTGIWN